MSGKPKMVNRKSLVPVVCPACGSAGRLNWKANKNAPKTIVLSFHPTTRMVVSVEYRCHSCGKDFDLGFDTNAYRTSPLPSEPPVPAWVTSAARELYARMEALDGAAAFAGQVEQSAEADRDEWCRQVADVILSHYRGETPRG